MKEQAKESKISQANKDMTEITLSEKNDAGQASVKKQQVAIGEEEKEAGVQKKQEDDNHEAKKTDAQKEQKAGNPIGNESENPKGKEAKNPIGQNVETSEEQENENPEGKKATDSASQETDSEEKQQPRKTAEQETDEKASGESPTPPSFAELAEEACKSVSNRHEIKKEDADSISHFLRIVISELVSGKISQDTTNMVLKSLHHDADVANAMREGEVKGRNAKIDEWKEQRRGIAGIHQLDNAGGNGMTHIPHARIGGLSAADRQTIWERGNEKRVRH